MEEDAKAALSKKDSGTFPKTTILERNQINDFVRGEQLDQRLSQEEMHQEERIIEGSSKFVQPYGSRSGYLPDRISLGSYITNPDEGEARTLFMTIKSSVGMRTMTTTWETSKANPDAITAASTVTQIEQNGDVTVNRVVMNSYISNNVLNGMVARAKSYTQD